MSVSGISVSVGSGVRVKVGRCVLEGIRLGVGVLDGVMDGMRDGVLVGISVAVDLGSRVLVGGLGVKVRKTTGVLDAVRVARGVIVSLGAGVGVPT